MRLSHVYELTEWALVANPASLYHAPEQVTQHLVGLCPERAEELGLDPRLPIETSSVRRQAPVSGLVTTNSGSVYRLVGPPRKDYAEWCAARGYNPETLPGGLGV